VVRSGRASRRTPFLTRPLPSQADKMPIFSNKKNGAGLSYTEFASFIKSLQHEVLRLEFDLYVTREKSTDVSVLLSLSRCALCR
jgi:hypothetical protein